MSIGVRHRAARQRRHQLDAIVASEAGENRSLPINHKLAHALRPLLARSSAHPGPSAGRTRQVLREWNVVQPSQAIAVTALLTGPKRLIGRPIDRDIVVHLVVGRNLEQMQRARTPTIERLDPDRRPALVKNTIVEIMNKVTIALEQAKPADIAIDERVRGHAPRIVERPPNALTAAGPNGQAVGIVDLRPPIGGQLAVVLAVPEHAGEWRHAEALDVLARHQLALDLHDDAVDA